jgi:DNA-binding NtrC family response regulator
MVNYPPKPILIVDDEEDVLHSYKISLRYSGINNLILCDDSRKVKSTMDNQAISLIILDLFMPFISGQELLPMIIEKHPDIPVIVITGSNRVETAVECMKYGAFDYMVKPVERSRLTSGVKRALEMWELKQEVDILSKRMLADGLQHPETFKDIITISQKMKAIFKYTEAISKSPKSVLITGESGVGKELIAKALHSLSCQAGDFVAVNVGGLDDTLFSDTLFGHKEGAYTGAKASRKGLIEKAEGGTLFLDEIGDLESTSQIKLLRLLQENEYYPLGADVPRICNLRIITATNQDLKEKQRMGLFRNDLYYRLITHHIHIPPLRERLEDIPFLVDHFLAQAASTLHMKKPTIPKELNSFLATYHFPGNIRELQSMIFDAVSRHKSRILSLSVFKEYMNKHKEHQVKKWEETETGGKKINYSGGFPTLKEVEDFFIKEAMEKAAGNQSIAAQLLGIAQSTLSRRFKSGK